MWCADAGLDARAANIVMRVVRNVADTGRTIVCTVHQPAIDIFEARTLPVVPLARMTRKAPMRRADARMHSLRGACGPSVPTVRAEPWM